jgi:hypothetical protein
MTNKKFEELSEDEFKNLKIEFAPGCFDNFEGTQEELDELVNSIKDMFASGEAQKKARPIDFDDINDEDLELLEKFIQMEDNSDKRNLQ